MLEDIIVVGEIRKQILQLQEMISETAFFANMAKNSTSVPISENEILTRIFTGQLMVVDRRDISVSPHLIMSGEWEMEITNIFRRFIRDDSVVFDVGANSGYFGIVAGSHLKQGELHFFEPNPNYIPVITKSLWLNGLFGKSKVNQNAVSSKDGENLILNIVEDLWGSSSLHEVISTVNIAERIEVKSLTLDSYIKENKIEKVDVVKIDVESHEEEVFKGMGNLLEQNPQAIVFMEYTVGAYTPSFFNSLQSKFKNIFAIKGDNITSINTEKELLSVSNEWVMLLLKNDDQLTN